MQTKCLLLACEKNQLPAAPTDLRSWTNKIYNDLFPPGHNVRLNEKTCMKCSLKMLYKCMILTASIVFPTLSGSLMCIWISKDLSAIFNLKKPHEIMIFKVD